MIQYFPIVTGSLTVLGNINVSGSITTSGSITISGSITSASFASTASFVALAQSASNAVSAATASFANTLTVAGNLTAQTLVVQTITSSVDFVTGSTRFGSILGNTHLFTGSVSMTGSLAVVTNGTEFQVTSTGVNFGNALTDSHIISGSLTINPNGLFVSSSGNVGIGITDLGPTGLSLPATSNYAWSEGSGNAYAVLFRQRNSGATVIASGYKRSNTAGFASSFGTSMSRAAIAIGSNNGSIAFFSDTATNVANGTDTTPTERMTILNNGNVGIGTTASNYPLHVYKSSGISTINVESVSGQNSQYRMEEAGAVKFAITYVPADLTTRMYFAGHGSDLISLKGSNVGISTVSPNARLDLGTGYGANGEKFLIYNDDSASALAGTKMGFYIDRFSESNSITFVFPYAPASTSRYHIAYKNTSNTTLVDLAYLNYNSTSWVFPSDERLKNIEGIIPNALDKIKDLRAVYYTQKRDPEQKRKVGLLAQDLLKVLPEIVDVPDTELDSDGNQRYMSVALGDTVPLLVKAIQELNTKFEEYKATHP